MKGFEPRTGLPSPRVPSYKRRLWHDLFRRQAVRLQGCKGLIRLHVRQQFPVYKEREKSHQSMSASLFARRQGIVRDGYLGLKEHVAHRASLRETSEFLCPSDHRDLRRGPSPTRGALWPKNRRRTSPRPSFRTGSWQSPGALYRKVLEKSQDRRP